MTNKFNLQYAMEVYGINVLVATELSPAFIAAQVMGRLVTHLYKRDPHASLKEVACSETGIQMGGFWEYQLYVEFDCPPRPQHALEAIGNAFKFFDVVKLDLRNPFAKPACGLKDASHALEVIKQNQSDIMTVVTQGARFAVARP